MKTSPRPGYWMGTVCIIVAPVGSGALHFRAAAKHDSPSSGLVFGVMQQRLVRSLHDRRRVSTMNLNSRPSAALMGESWRPAGVSLVTRRRLGGPQLVQSGTSSRHAHADRAGPRNGVSRPDSDRSSWA